MMPLQARLDNQLPDVIHVGRGSAMLLRGSYDVPAVAGEVAVMVDGVARPPEVISRAGERRQFWSIVQLPSTFAPSDLSIVLRHREPCGAESWDVLAELHLSAGRPDAPAADPPLAGRADAGALPLVAICLATYQPKAELLRAQIESLRAQRHVQWIALISDDGSSPAACQAISALTAGDDRFHIIWNRDRRGYYGNFERALMAVPAWADYVALCDQDDIWHPQKLRRLIDALAPRARSLACCDARVVDDQGRVRSHTMWTSRRRGGGDLRSLLAANSVCGATTVFDRRLLDVALPFPVGPDILYHDQWIGVVAAAGGGVTWVDEPLVDYVQHDGNAFGHARAVADEVTHLRLNQTLHAMASAGAPRSSLPGHIDALMRARLLETALTLRLGRHGEPLQRSVGDWRRVAARHAGRALLARARGGAAGAEAGVAWGALAAAATARQGSGAS
ncbi:MAG: glycosyltransferase [Solirubrobacteraceae bacterium]|jgi:hypothetical protein